MQLQTAKGIITKVKLVADFKAIGILEGDTVAVTLSLKSIGYIEGGADTFIDALLETVGSHGTIMMNAYTNTFPASEIPSHYIFDPATTAPNTGIAPKTLLKRRGAIRSTHPVCSVVAIGENAKYLTQTHNEKAQTISTLHSSCAIKRKIPLYWHRQQFSRYPPRSPVPRRHPEVSAPRRAIQELQRRNWRVRV